MLYLQISIYNNKNKILRCVPISYFLGFCFVSHPYMCHVHVACPSFIDNDHGGKQEMKWSSTEHESTLRLFAKHQIVKKIKLHSVERNQSAILTCTQFHSIM